MTRYAPLSVWLITLTLIAGVLGTLQWAGQAMHDARQHALISSQEERIAAYMSSESPPRILMLGNSLMRSALPFRGLPHTPWLRVYYPGNRFEPFIALWPTILANPPEILIVHAELLLPYTRTRERDSTEATLNDNLRLWRERLEYLRMDKAIFQKRLMHQANRAQSHASCGKVTPNWEQTYQKMHPRQGRYRMTPAIKPEAARALREAAQRIPTIILMDIPRSQSVETAFGEDTRHWLEAVRTELEDLPGLRIWRVGEALEDSCYCDYRHLKPACREKLVPAITTLANYIQPIRHD